MTGRLVSPWQSYGKRGFGTSERSSISGPLGALMDRELLGLFVARRDEAAEIAFSCCVERHGPMVLSRLSVNPA